MSVSGLFGRDLSLAIVSVARPAWRSPRQRVWCSSCYLGVEGACGPGGFGVVLCAGSGVILRGVASPCTQRALVGGSLGVGSPCGSQQSSRRGCRPCYSSRRVRGCRVCCHRVCRDARSMALAVSVSPSVEGGSVLLVLGGCVVHVFFFVPPSSRYCHGSPVGGRFVLSLDS